MPFCALVFLGKHICVVQFVHFPKKKTKKKKNANAIIKRIIENSQEHMRVLYEKCMGSI